MNDPKGQRTQHDLSPETPTSRPAALWALWKSSSPLSLTGGLPQFPYISKSWRIIGISGQVGEVQTKDFGPVTVETNNWRLTFHLTGDFFSQVEGKECHPCNPSLFL